MGLILTVAYCQQDSAPDPDPIPTAALTPTANANVLPAQAA